MTIYSADTELGQSLVSAPNLDAAKASVERSLHGYATELGYLPEINSIKPATDEDIAWVAAMGGYVPKEVTIW